MLSGGFCAGRTARKKGRVAEPRSRGILRGREHQGGKKTGQRKNQFLAGQYKGGWGSKKERTQEIDTSYLLLTHDGSQKRGKGVKKAQGSQ